MVVPTHVIDLHVILFLEHHVARDSHVIPLTCDVSGIFFALSESRVSFIRCEWFTVTHYYSNVVPRCATKVHCFSLQADISITTHFNDIVMTLSFMKFTTCVKCCFESMLYKVQTNDSGA